MHNPQLKRQECSISLRQNLHKLFGSLLCVKPVCLFSPVQPFLVQTREFLKCTLGVFSPLLGKTIDLNRVTWKVFAFSLLSCFVWSSTTLCHSQEGYGRLWRAWNRCASDHFLPSSLHSLPSEPGTGPPSFTCYVEGGPGICLVSVSSFRTYPSVSIEILIYSFCSSPKWQILENKKSLEKLKEVIAVNSSELAEVKCLQLLQGTNTMSSFYWANIWCVSEYAGIEKCIMSHWESVAFLVFLCN